jgi:hypothetical protein
MPTPIGSSRSSSAFSALSAFLAFPALVDSVSEAASAVAGAEKGRKGVRLHYRTFESGRGEEKGDGSRLSGLPRR